MTVSTATSIIVQDNYYFGEITGFRWSYLSRKVRYKSIKFRTVDSRVYQFSNFEVGNFRGIEELISKNFELKFGKGWLSPSEKQKQFELQRSRAFNIEVFVTNGRKRALVN